MEAYLLKHAFVTIFIFPSILAGVSRVGQSDQCLFLVAISVRSRTSDPSAQKDGQMALEGLLLRSGICRHEWALRCGLGRTTGCIYCEAQWLEWIDLDTWYILILYIIVSNIMFCSISYKGKKSLGLRIAWFANFEPMAKTSKRRGSMKCHSPTKSMISSSSEAWVQWSFCWHVMTEIEEFLLGLQCYCRTPVYKPWTKETTVLIETCEASALNSKKIVSKEMPPNMTRQNDRTLLQRHDVPLGGKDLKDLTVLQGLAEHERQSGMSARLGMLSDSPNTSVFPGWLWRPPATAGYGPAPTRDNYMGMGGWNGGMACGRVWQKVGKSLGFRMFWEGLRLLEVWPKPKSDESTWFSLCFFLILSLGLDELLLLCIARPFDLQQAQHRVCWTSQRRQTNFNAVSNVNVRICFIQCCTGISHQLFIHWICKN